jgi:1,5-anhydro-D-fructose reductase (1,5-anhydro-D-mannitol-forming)
MIDRPLRIAAVGFWHVHADDYAKAAREHPGTELVAVWDDDPERLAAAGERWQVEATADLDALLARDDVDGITVTTATTEHDRVIAAALAAGKHVFTEKVLSPTVAGAERLVDLAAERGLALTVSLPRLFDGPYLTLRRLQQEGVFGQLVYVRARIAHDGALAGWLPERFHDPNTAVGGVFFDLGCHPAYLIQHLLGADPATVRVVQGHVTNRTLDDNTTVLLGYQDGAIGVAEASSVTVPGAFALELRGTRGSAVYGFGGERLLAKGEAFGEDWTELTVDADEPPAFDRWVRRIRGEQVDDPTARAAIDLTRLLVAAETAAAQ